MPLSQKLRNGFRKSLPFSWQGRWSRAKMRTKWLLRWHLWRLQHPGTDYCCPYCGSEFGQFMPYVNPHAVSVDADIISGQSIAAYACPRCRSNDRERALYFFVGSRNGFLTSKRILHFAPERHLSPLIASADAREYICADLDTRNYAHLKCKVERIDVTDIGYPDESFDLVICNHVLEHIPDDARAMRELFRVLAKQGVAILMVPIGARLQATYEDPSKVTGEARAAAFGQYDHVRVYEERSYLHRLRSAGFEVRAHALDLGMDDIVRYGINPREKIYLGLKR